MTALPTTHTTPTLFPTAGAVATVEACLGRIRALNLTLNALITVDEKGALSRALVCDEAAADGQHLGPLHGMPVVLKDNIDAVGFETSSGSPMAARTPDAD